MVIGEKIKKLRLLRKMTQKELASDFMTRNMLSQIENSIATPSYASLKYLSQKLDISPSYFFSDEDDFANFELLRILPHLRDLYQRKEYSEFLKEALPFDSTNFEELYLMICSSYYELGLQQFNENHLDAALVYLNAATEASRHCHLSLNCTSRIPFYQNLMESSSLNGRLVSSSFPNSSKSDDDFVDFVIYSYLMFMMDSNQSEKAAMLYDSVRIKNNLYRTHFNARLAASHFNYERARELLTEIILDPSTVPVPILLNIYGDLELYCKALEDYEGAYRCLIEKQKLQ